MKQVFYKNTALKSRLYVWRVNSCAETLVKLVQLNPKEQRDYKALKTEKRKVEFLACRIALKSLFTNSLLLQHKKSGKPYIKEVEHVSISHSHNYIAIAFGDIEVGIDIEKPQEKMLRLIPRVLSEEENTNFLKKPSTKLACKLWGAKESVLKYIGDKNLNYRDDIILKENTATYLDKQFNIYHEEIEGMILTYVDVKQL